MNNSYYIAAIAAAVLTAFPHMLLKRGAMIHQTWLRRWLNVPVLIAYAMLFGITLIALYAYKVVPLRLGVGLSALTLVLVIALSMIFFRERATRTQMFGCVLIVAGIVLLSL